MAMVGVMSFASVHDCAVVLLSLLTLKVLGKWYLFGQSMYGLGKFHDHHNPNLLSQVSHFVFILTLMTGCALLEIFTFDLIGYLQPVFRLWLCSVLVTLLSLLLRVVIPALLGASLLCPNDSDSGNDSDSDSILCSGGRGSAHDMLKSVRYTYLVAGAAGVGGSWWLLHMITGVLPIHTTTPSSQPTALLGSPPPSPPLHLGGLVLLGTAVAAVLGGFAAVHFPLDVYLVSKYAGQLSERDLARGEARLRSSIAATNVRRDCLLSSGFASAASAATGRGDILSAESLMQSPTRAVSSNISGGGVFRRNVSASPSKQHPPHKPLLPLHAHPHPHRDRDRDRDRDREVVMSHSSPYPSNSNGTSTATSSSSAMIASELSVLNQVSTGLSADLQVVLRLRSHQATGRQRSLLGRAERMYGLALSLWGLVRVCIGACRVCWWMWLTQVLLLLAPADDFNDSFNNNSTDNNMNNNNIINNNNDLEYTLTSSTDTHSDSVVQQASASPLSSLLPLSSLSSLFVLAVLAMAVLQVKLFLQSVHLMGSLSLSLGPSSWARHSSAQYSLLLALAAGCYCLACPLFLHAFARTLAPLLGLGVGVGPHVPGEGSQAAALALVVGDDINFNLLFRLFDAMFVCSTLCFLAYLWISFQFKIRSMDLFLDKHPPAAVTSANTGVGTGVGVGSNKYSGSVKGSGGSGDLYEDDGCAFNSDLLYPV